MTSEPIVRLTDVGVTYPGPPPTKALEQVDLTIQRGDHVAIVGPSGSGKSTLLSVVGLLHTPTTGTYQLDGIDVSTLRESQRAAARGQRIGFVFQSFHLLDQRSAVENVMMGTLYHPRRHTQQERVDAALRVLDQVGMSHRIQAPPSTLSGGERQRVAIARALVGNPDVVLCDEPTGNLDSVNASRVLALLDDLNAAGQTIVVITHDAHVAAQADTRYSITDGRLREC